MKGCILQSIYLMAFWIIITNTPLTFTLNCKSDGHNLADIKVEPSFGIIKINNTCKTSSKY